MAVLKSWYVLVFLITSVWSSDDQVEKESYLDKLQSLKQLATGYNNQDEYDRKKLENLSLVDLRQKHLDLYRYLECGYFYSTLFHLKLMGDAVFDNIKDILTPETIEDFLFDKEASMMLDSLLVPNNYEVKNLWLVFIYTRQIRVFFGQIVNDGGKFSSKVLNKTRRMHEFVLTEIEKDLDRCMCPLENSFNINYENHNSLAEQQLSLCNNSEAESASAANNGSVIDAIQQKKRLLHNNFEKNRQRGLLEFSMSESLTDGLFLFHDKETYKLIIDEFVVDNSNRSTLFISAPFPNITSGLEGVKVLKKRQRQIIGTLKILMLEMMLSYTLKSQDRKSDQFIEFLNYTNTFKLQIVGKFMDIMSLHDNVAFKNVYEIFASCLLHEKDLFSFIKCMSKVQQKMYRLINVITNNILLPKIKSIVSDCEGENVISKPTVEDFLRVGKMFVDKIENHIIPHSIRLAESFWIMVREKILTNTSTTSRDEAN
ncbi:uncharacterized protein LOC126842116 [Adelges cooleyi]|uniref:uncharacterized protein LOC126842116 n=1 Tax=Adelges cooleyi TaxID=133065 RepID=UPI00217FCBCC|nr:uncharacterized protein LOC126842116 [Adelges cooleyi]XP_050434965.1 uncharacterized protein LOC126842116 [Adelges cooleyi]